MEPIIREVRPEDRSFIKEIAKLTWGGEDYLARVFDEWLGDNFYALEVDGRVVGTAKLTLLPGRVGWLEGLRMPRITEAGVMGGSSTTSCSSSVEARKGGENKCP